MAAKFGKAEVTSMAEVLDGDYESAEEAARAALVEAEEILAKRAKFVVVGQLSGTRERPEIPPSDQEAIQVSLGWYSTEGDARSAAESLWSSTASGDTYRVWVLPTFHGTPAELHTKAKEKYAAEAAKANEKTAERRRRHVEAREAAAEERARALRERCRCRHKAIEHQGWIGKFGRCRECSSCGGFDKMMEAM